MNELVTRLISGTLFMIIILVGTTHSHTSFLLLYLILGCFSVYEMWNILVKKSLLPMVFVLLPFFLINSLVYYKNCNWY